MPSSATIKDVSVATIRGQLPAPVIFGDWVMKEREFAAVRITTDKGVEGWAFTLTRDGAVAEQIRKAIAPVYVGTDIADREKTFKVAKGRTYGSHSAGIGLRALSLMDLACWDIAAKLVDKPIAEFLGGKAKPMPATAIIGYPPAMMPPEKVGEQVRELCGGRLAPLQMPDGRRRWKNRPRGCGRRARRRPMPGSAPIWCGCSRPSTRPPPMPTRSSDLNLGCIEDIFPPGNAGKLAELRKRVKMPIWQGDEQGGSYYPEALILAKSVDLVRVDLTCMGGITGGRAIIDECLAAGVDFGPHMFAHVHSQVFSAWGFDDRPIEWGVPWTGVDPYADSLENAVRDGRADAAAQAGAGLRQHAQPRMGAEPAA